LLVFEAKQVVARVEKMGELFAPVLELKQRLPDLKSLAATAEEEPTISIAAQAQDADEPEDTPRTAAKKTAKRTSARKPKPKV